MRTSDDVITYQKVLDLLWDPTLQQQDAVDIYNVIRDLFVKHTPSEPWELLKDIIIKENKKDAKLKKQQQWAGVTAGRSTHPILYEMESNAKLFKNRGIDTAALRQQFKDILNGDLGELQDYVDSSDNIAGRRQTVEVRLFCLQRLLIDFNFIFRAFLTMCLACLCVCVCVCVCLSLDAVYHRR